MILIGRIEVGFVDPSGALHSFQKMGDEVIAPF
jgi:hypothetical protein